MIRLILIDRINLKRIHVDDLLNVHLDFTSRTTIDRVFSRLFEYLVRKYFQLVLINRMLQ